MSERCICGVRSYDNPDCPVHGEYQPAPPSPSAERLRERLPPRPKCADCGLESLTGNVHEPTCPQISTPDRPEVSGPRSWWLSFDSLKHLATIWTNVPEYEHPKQEFVHVIEKSAYDVLAREFAKYRREEMGPMTARLIAFEAEIEKLQRELERLTTTRPADALTAFRKERDEARAEVERLKNTPTLGLLRKAQADRDRYRKALESFVETGDASVAREALEGNENE